MKSVPEIAASYRADIIVRQWAATWVDLLLAGLMLGPVAFALEHVSDAFFIVGLLATVFGYHLVFEASVGATPGKWLVGIRVVEVHGNPPRFWQALVRTLARLVEVNPLLFGGLPAGLIADNTKYRQRLGDLLARTFVVKVRDLRDNFPILRGARLRGPESRIFEKRLG